MAVGDKKPVVMESDIGQDGGPAALFHAAQHRVGGADPLSAADLGAVPAIGANSAEYDMDVILKSGEHCAVYKTGMNTKGTPYAYGKTDFQRAAIHSYAYGTTYGAQIAFLYGRAIPYVRFLKNGAIGEWTSLYGETHKPTADDIGAVPTTRTINGKTLDADIILTAEETSAIPVVNADDSAYDMDDILKVGAHGPWAYKTGSNTLGTPFKKGDVPTNFKRALIISYSGAAKYGFQIAFPNGLPYMLTRRLNNGVLDEHWQKVYSEGYKPTAADVEAVPYLAEYYPLSTAQTADDLVVPFALIPVGIGLNEELYNIVGGAFAYVNTMFYIEAATTSSRMQIATSYDAAEPAMAFRIYGADGWLPWQKFAAGSPSQLDQIEAQVTYTAMMTDTLLEV